MIIPEKLRPLPPDKIPLTELIRGRLEVMGPVTATALAELMQLPVGMIEESLYRLEQEGFVLRGNFSTPDELEWCDRRLLARIHRYTLKKLRREIQPVSSAGFMRFLFAWHQVVPGSQGEGPVALEQALLKLEGAEAPAVAWESDVLPARIAGYDHHWLDLLCISGKTAWGRLRPAAVTEGKRIYAPVRTTPLTFVSRQHLSLWKSLHAVPEKEAVSGLSPRALQVWQVLKQRGASFFDDLVIHARLFPSQIEETLGELISAGLVSSDSFTGLRALLVPAKYKTNAGERRRTEMFSMSYAGRWSLLDNPQQDQPLQEAEKEIIVWALLRRYGVLFRRLADRESLAPPWRDLVRTLRTMEARGQIRGGRFVEGVWGEQFALPEVIAELRRHKEDACETLVAISAADPLNLTGVITPGRRIPGFPGNRILYRGGVPIALKEAGVVQFLDEAAEAGNKWALQNALVQRSIPPALRKYLGSKV